MTEVPGTNSAVPVMTAMTEKHVQLIEGWKSYIGAMKVLSPGGWDEAKLTQVNISIREILSNIQSQLPGGSKVLIERSEIEEVFRDMWRFLPSHYCSLDYVRRWLHPSPAGSKK